MADKVIQKAKLMVTGYKSISAHTQIEAQKIASKLVAEGNIVFIHNALGLGGRLKKGASQYSVIYQKKSIIDARLAANNARFEREFPQLPKRAGTRISQPMPPLR